MWWNQFKLIIYQENEFYKKRGNHHQFKGFIEKYSIMILSYILKEIDILNKHK